jgi:hypothetical protein
VLRGDLCRSCGRPYRAAAVVVVVAGVDHALHRDDPPAEAGGGSCLQPLNPIIATEDSSNPASSFDGFFFSTIFI